MTISRQLANYCIRFYNARRGFSDRSRASSREDFKALLQRGYSGVCGGSPQQARQFLNAAGVAHWGELDNAAAAFARQAGLGQNAHWGARDFLGVSWTIGELDRQVGGNGIGPRPLTPTVTDGYSRFSDGERSRMARQATTWCSQAVIATRQPRFASVPESMRGFYREQAEAAKTLYVTAVDQPGDFPAVARTPYFEHLHIHASDLWGAYKVARYPAQRQMARRLALSILTGHDPYSNSPPPSSAISSFLSSVWSGLSGQ